MSKVDKSRLTNIRMHSSLALSTSRKSTTRQSAQKPEGNQNPKPEYKPLKLIGQGAFGVVYCARSSDSKLVAIKKVLVDPRYKNRELETLQEINHPNCISILGHFKSQGKKPNEIYLNIVMEYVQMSLHQFNMQYRRERRYTPILYVKIFSFQMFSALNYLHRIGITHRDLKPQNILCNSDTGMLKICDFGSAKQLLPNEKSVSYIASRYYRAPELIFDCVYYTSSIDIWAAGCVLAEIIMAGMPIFAGNTSMGQLHEIVKVLGVPTEEDLASFQHSATFNITEGKHQKLEAVLPKHTPPDLLDLLKAIFVYNPSKRPTALECMKHHCFDELFEPGQLMPSGNPFPSFNREGST